MFISPISLHRTAPSFQRKLKEEEKPEYKQTIKDAYDFLGVKNVAMIMHGSCFPSLGKDIGTGSPYSKAAEQMMDFEQLHGFNSVQLGPPGKLSRPDFSPYVSKVFAKNHLFIDLDKLQTKNYANILSAKTVDLVTYDNKVKDKNYNYSNFAEAFENIDAAMTEAHANFKEKVAKRDPKALELNKEFGAFKEKNKNWLEKDGLFKVLSNLYGTDDFKQWKNPLDENLIHSLDKGNPNAKKRVELLKTRSENKIEKNDFVQFIADKQLKENTALRKEKGFNYINDLLVGFSKSDLWANKDAFLENWELGCPYGGKDNGPQTWGIPVLDPKKIFNKDGSLGVAGQLLKDKIAVSTDAFENIRVDHALGLVDPFIYKPSEPEKVAKRDPKAANNISFLPNLDPDGNYKKILSKIVLPTMKENGINPREAVWEDLVSDTPTFNEVYHNQEHLPGITQTLWGRAENSPKDNWILLGSHDDKPMIVAVKDDEWVLSGDSWNTDYLGGFLNADPKRSVELQAFKEKLNSNPKEKIKAKFAELFRGPKNIQISFADFFGLSQTYNLKGQNNDSNWKLRLNNNYEDSYHKNLESSQPTALNMPEILKMAVQAKKDMILAKMTDKHSPNVEQTRADLDKKTQPILDELAKFEEVLKEKE